MKLKLKYNLFFTLILFVTSNIFSQDTRIHGHWKPFAIDNGEFYMNVETDSISLYDEFEYIANDSLKIIQLKKTANQIYFKQTHTFSENGKYIQNLIVMKLELDYKIDVEKNLILTSKNNFLNEKDILELPYWIKDDIFYMEIPVTEPSIKIWLKK